MLDHGLEWEFRDFALSWKDVFGSNKGRGWGGEALKMQ